MTKKMSQISFDLLASTMQETGKATVMCKPTSAERIQAVHDLMEVAKALGMFDGAKHGGAIHVDEVSVTFRATGA